jgi:UDPglucose--hexose-1-phosphate uridylyltransferase
VDLRRDPLTGAPTVVVGSRQGRPNLPSSDVAATDCPFCPGGLEAPEDYDVRSFVNRWPAMPDYRCELVLYTPDHDAAFWSLGIDGARRVVDRWAERTAELGARDDVDYVLIFENRGPEVGATIAHPHGQIYAYDHVPERQRRLLTAGWAPELDAGERFVVDHGGNTGWFAWVPVASTFPVALTLAPKVRVPDIASLDESGRTDLATILVDVLARLDRLYDAPLPYMMWLNQRPTDGVDHPEAWFNIEIVSPWRRAGTSRFIAAAEVACNEYFNPVIPEVVAERLRDLG